MNRTLVDRIARTVLYEGYVLYPYRPCVKNRHRWTFGALFPADQAVDDSGASSMRTECLLLGTPSTRVEVKVRFLHLLSRRVAALETPVMNETEVREESVRFVEALEVDGRLWQSWQEAVEREVVVGPVALGDLVAQPFRGEFTFPAFQRREPLRDGTGAIRALIQRDQCSIAGDVVVAATDLGDGVFRITVRVDNRTSLAACGLAPATDEEWGGSSKPLSPRTPGEKGWGEGDYAQTARTIAWPSRPLTPDPSPPEYRGRGEPWFVDSGSLLSTRQLEPTGRDEAILRALVSTHMVLSVSDGAFVSMLDPPGPLRQFADECKNVGVFPVLVGSGGERDTMLASPIILYDYPQVAPESAGDFYDGTEIDEMLTLRIMTLTDDEKRAMASVDDRARDLLERTESTARAQMMRLHGTFREPEEAIDSWNPFAACGLAHAIPEAVVVQGVTLRKGSAVRLVPGPQADVMDLALAGKSATVESIEQDCDGQTYLAVTVDDDPGKDFGQARQIAHRFFFRPDEVEPIGGES